MKHGILVGDLPKRLVRLPIDDISQVAVLSWRWDQDCKGRSRNLAIAIEYSRLAGIRYLFTDTISIDQMLSSVELISKVAEFSILYSIIPVIATYDLKESLKDRIRAPTLQETMSRPWIFSEIRLLAKNPTKVVYVGHNSQGAYIQQSPFCYILGYLPRSRIGHTNFKNELLWAWQTDFVACILNLLNGTTNITNIHNLKFILPAFFDVLTKVEELDKNDYLLTVALLVSASKYGEGPRYEVVNDFTRLKYKQFHIKSHITHKVRYSLAHPMDSGSVDGPDRRSEEVYTVLLKPAIRKLAVFRQFHEYPISSSGQSDVDCNRPGYSMRVFKTTERDVFEMLGLGATEYERYIMQ